MIVHEKAKIKTLYIKIRFIAEYRFGNDDSKGGFERCLKVSAGNSLGLEIDGHRFFGTDKFGVDTAWHKDPDLLCFILPARCLNAKMAISLSHL